MPNTDQESLDRKKEVLLVLYRENCDQARQHESYRDKVCGLAATTVGILLGLLGFNSGALASPSIPHLAIPAFIVVLGLWTRKTTGKHDERAALHRKRIAQIRLVLEEITGLNLVAMNTAAKAAHEEGPDSYHDKRMLDVRTFDVWKSFGSMIVGLGCFLAVVIVLRLFHVL